MLHLEILESISLIQRLFWDDVEKWMYGWKGVVGFSFMELRDLGEIDFYSIFSLLCRSESKMFRAHFPLHIPCIFSYPCVELLKIHPMSLLPFLHIDFRPSVQECQYGTVQRCCSYQQFNYNNETTNVFLFCLISDIDIWHIFFIG